MSEERIFALKDWTCIAEVCLGRHNNLITAERRDRGTAQSFFRNEGDDVRPIEVQEVFGKIQAGLEKAAWAVDLNDDQIGASIASHVELAIDIVFQKRCDWAFESDQGTLLEPSSRLLVCVLGGQCSSIHARHDEYGRKESKPLAMDFHELSLRSCRRNAALPDETLVSLC
jgi:hypothetical protein